MRLLTILALFMLPMTMVQFYSSDSYALTSKVAPQELSFYKTTLPKKRPSNLKSYGNEDHYLKTSAVTQEKNHQAKTESEPSSKTNKVRLVQGKRNTQGMQLLSVLLMLKDKRK